MTYQNVWWYPNYVEYGAGLNSPKTWPNVMEQYRKPDPLRQYDLPTENYEAKLYYRLPHLGKPVYRGTFRDKPATVAPHYPGPDPQGKPKGFYGRMYYEDGPPQFKYQGPQKDDLYWLERPPYLPSFPKSRPGSTGQGGEFDTSIGFHTSSSRGQRSQSGSRQGSRSQVGSPMGPTAAAGGPHPPATPMKPTMTSSSSNSNPQAYTRTMEPMTDTFMSTYKSAYTNPTKRSTLDGVGYL